MNCRLCQAHSKYQSIKGNSVYGGTPEHKFWECGKCKIVYLYPPLSDDDEKKFYNREFEKYMRERSGIDTKDGWLSAEEHVKVNQPEAERRMRTLKPLAAGRSMKILEVGCSSGFMLFNLRDMKHLVSGVELSGNFTEFLKQQNIEAFRDIKEIEENNLRFDLIIHYYVLEHIRKPLEFIREYMELLVPGGKMLFEIPNVRDPLVSLYKIPAFDSFYWSIAHHWYFSYESMSYLLDKLGYKYNIAFEQRYDLSNHIVWMLEGKPGGKSRYSNIFSPQTDARYREDLKKSGFCDTLLVEIEK